MPLRLRELVANARTRLRPAKAKDPPPISRLHGVNSHPRTLGIVARSIDFVKPRVRRLNRKATRSIVHEGAILGLETLKESASVFPPLESALGGLLKLVHTCENANDCQELHERIRKIEQDLHSWAARAQDAPAHSGELATALQTFHTSLEYIMRDVETLLIQQSKRKWWRFLLARKHKLRIDNLLSRLSIADEDFQRCLGVQSSRQIAVILDTVIETTEDMRILRLSVFHYSMVASSLIGLFA
ncbi:unnamed protein product [Peniophora sp. CBMAI 1063]|nr:unnamed protein product [Peniophora sp. CBMAI 1063]